MVYPILDATLHLDETLSARQIEALEQALHARTGVISARVTLRNARLILVQYSPCCCSVSDLLRLLDGLGHPAAVRYGGDPPAGTRLRECQGVRCRA
ncbi:hypothetical protein SAMN05660831_00890 [Thiohalospira halophila DSM 15071]|uniref:HMA domain-containing protein n=2 Tax=Thiohalospira halophila TaxID=381300 RepID=A0A1I1Q5B1_9GAMM|nr:hypothetical protein SAMN05660831_00890 [Thiohalospira halophila DSM 15071]